MNCQCNPKRVKAGKANRIKRGLITDSSRNQLRLTARTNRPWEKSTGPTTERGKEICSWNGRKRQIGPWSVRAVRRELKTLNQLLDQLLIAQKEGVSSSDAN
jgi:hypothetical protein